MEVKFTFEEFTIASTIETAPYQDYSPISTLPRIPLEALTPLPCAAKHSLALTCTQNIHLEQRFYSALTQVTNETWLLCSLFSPYIYCIAQETVQN